MGYRIEAPRRNATLVTLGARLAGAGAVSFRGRTIACAINALACLRFHLGQPITQSRDSGVGDVVAPANFDQGLTRFPVS